MRAQRQQVASQLRAEGQEEQKIQIGSRPAAGGDPRRSRARDAQKLRGEGDAEAARIYGEAASGPGFYRSSAAWVPTARPSGGSDVIVLERNDPFLQYMRDDR